MSEGQTINSKLRKGKAVSNTSHDLRYADFRLPVIYQLRNLRAYTYLQYQGLPFFL